MFGKEACFEDADYLRRCERGREESWLGEVGRLTTQKSRPASEATMAKSYCWVVEYVNMIFLMFALFPNLKR